MTHLQSAADAFARVMGQLEPQHTWVGVVRERQSGDRKRLAAAPVGGQDASAVLEHPNLVGGRDTTAPNYDRLEQAA